jgi:hypothetical protein
MPNEIAQVEENTFTSNLNFPPVGAQLTSQMNVSSAPQRWKRRIDFLIALARAVPIFLKYKDRTMIEFGKYIENLALMSVALRYSDLGRGAIVECGTWRGGMSAGMVETGGLRRRYYFFDSFEGLPPVQDIDGPAARQWQANTAGTTFYNNCAASLEDFRDSIAMTGCPPGKITILKGFFEDTLPAFDLPPIAVLRLDADWYASTAICLEKFWDRVMVGGLVLIDDYYTWDGCARAVHDFFAKRQATARIYQGPVGGTAYILKKFDDPHIENVSSRGELGRNL